MSTIGIIFLCIALVAISVFITLAICVDDSLFLYGIIIGIVPLMFSIGDTMDIPKDRDVEQGKAYYVETQHISVRDNDTIRYSTYEIKWKEE